MDPGSNSSQDSSANMEKIAKKEDVETNIDRLTELPEPLIIRILSFLEMKDAVNTDTVAKSLRHLWTHVDSIVFFFNAMPNGDYIERFIAFADRTMPRCACPNIKKFVLHFYHDPGAENGPFLNEMFFNWVHRAFENNVEFLGLQINDLTIEPPEWFYQSLFLIRLKLYDVILGSSFVRQIDWPSLRSLNLKRVEINNEQMAQLLSGCPQLDTMVLDRVSHIITSLNFTSKSMKTLKLIHLDRDDDEIPLQIKASWLQELIMTKEFWGFNCHFLNMSSMRKADLSFTVLGVDTDEYWVDVQRFNVATELLKTVCNVEELVIGPVLILVRLLLHNSDTFVNHIPHIERALTFLHLNLGMRTYFKINYKMLIWIMHL
ncbi:F-box/LRR-repeat protein At3g03360-like [Sesamum indicum]|uniref:F-box/LRR-repeat protein At3g03360-like n=1 Tax=Sesamum indicum TaxID=4182 RepID=A0A6I9TRX8_SESIN|nr:F-box/LRR-repeat protein At3g03360-like [Sesamum indicum]